MREDCVHWALDTDRAADSNVHRKFKSAERFISLWTTTHFPTQYSIGLPSKQASSALGVCALPLSIVTLIIG
ncbi:hypothetical protein P879_01336 [Paragonimus westermani]|uniref:Uncharacterized protein n=1 Tax=Paragonimus westermani TaxID=34504 RepID=A0A8T0DUK6_9TREM|nr:hypothetical protein P879_01336 [Paragonimus westermani]